MVEAVLESRYGCTDAVQLLHRPDTPVCRL